MYGTADRKLSEKFGLWVWLCWMHHNSGLEQAVHSNKEYNLLLRQKAQILFRERFPDKDWMAIFGKNYIEDKSQSRKIIEKIDNKVVEFPQGTRLSENQKSENQKDLSGKPISPPDGFWFLDDE